MQSESKREQVLVLDDDLLHRFMLFEDSPGFVALQNGTELPIKLLDLIHAGWLHDFGRLNFSLFLLRFFWLGYGTESGSLWLTCRL